MFTHSTMVQNGDMYCESRHFECNRCKEYIHESFPQWKEVEKDFHYCWDCAFINQKISESTYLMYNGIDPSLAYTMIDGEEIHIYLK